jgi:hypothetical protein
MISMTDSGLSRCHCPGKPRLFFKKFGKHKFNISSHIIKCKSEKLVLGFEVGKLQYEIHFW